MPKKKTTQKPETKPKREDRFLTDDDKVVADHATIINPTEADIMDEMGQLEGFRDYQREIDSFNV